MNRRQALKSGVVATLASCYGDSAPPEEPQGQDPIPTPVVEPTPLPIRAGMVADGNGWAYKGKRHLVLGAIPCDWAAEWSILNPRELERIAVHRGNYTHIRLGPFWAPYGEPLATLVKLAKADSLESWYLRCPSTRAMLRSEYDAAVRDSAYKISEEDPWKVDLDEWNPVFWERVLNTLCGAAEIEDRTGNPFPVEVDAIDGWAMDHKKLSPWFLSNNIQGIGCAGLDIMRAGAPSAIHTRFLRKVVKETGWANVFYQIGNETFKGTSMEWELGVRDIIRDALKAYKYPERPIGTNSHDRSVERRVNYASRHCFEAPNPENYPVWVNEFDDATVSVQDWKGLAKQALKKGTVVHAWSCNQDDYEGLLDAMMEVVS
jgi:hypothetical protein